MNRTFAFALILVAACLLAGCASHTVSAPINPYVDPEVGRYHPRKVAVMPLIIPEYLKVESGAEMVSIQLTNQLIGELNSRQLFGFVDGDKIKAAINKTYPSPRDWLFTGNINDALKIGRTVDADSVIFGRVVKYLQGNLGDSEVEIELTMIDLATTSTLWNVRELVLGKGGMGISGTSTDLVTSARACAMTAVEGAADKIYKIHKKGRPIKVTSYSPKKIAGYTLTTVGVASLAVSGFYVSEANKYYSDYGKADNDYDLSRYKDKTEQADLMWQIWGGIGLVTLGTGIYFLVTDDTKMAGTETNKPESRFVLAPLLSTKRQGFACLFRF